MVSASGSETRDSSSTPASAVIYDAYNSIIKKQIPRLALKRAVRVRRLLAPLPMMHILTFLNYTQKKKQRKKKHKTDLIQFH